jgi:hypothetical protein
MAYSGGWKNRAYIEPGRAIYQPDPAHAALDTPDPNAFTYDAPPLPDAGYGQEFTGMEVFVQLPGVTLDTTPDNHDGDGVGHPTRLDDQEMQADSERAHGTNYGASRKSNFYPGPFDFAGEHQVHTIVGGLDVGSTAVNTVALQRGLNGLAENNPEGFRPGQTELWRFDRKFYEGERRHDQRVVTLNTAYQPSNVPPPSREKFTPYSSPFGSLARPLTRVWQRPEVRRDPTGLSEGITTDGAADYSDPIGSEWVM